MPQPSKTQKKALDPAPNCSEAELSAARKELQDEAERKRARSSMKHYLESTGQYDAYMVAPMPVKRGWLERHWAHQLANGGGIKTSKRVVQTNQHKERDFEWMNKWAMIQRFGEVKAVNKINSGKLQEQPDKDTGLTGEWDIEYKVFKETGGEAQSNITKDAVQSKEEITKNQAEEAVSALNDKAQSLMDENWIEQNLKEEDIIINVMMMKTENNNVENKNQ